VEGVWLDFLNNMCTLEVFLLHGSLHGRVPGPLPRLHAIKAHAADLAKFAEGHITLCHLWFDRSKPLAESQLGPVELTPFAASFSQLDTIRISAPDLLLLISGAPKFVSMLGHIVIDEDLTWSDFTLNGGPSLVCIRYFYSLALMACLFSHAICSPSSPLRSTAVSFTLKPSFSFARIIARAALIAGY
jgi:hypothetical protein